MSNFLHCLNKDPNMSMTSQEELTEWLEKPISGDLSQVPGIGNFIIADKELVANIQHLLAVVIALIIQYFYVNMYMPIYLLQLASNDTLFCYFAM